MIGLAETSFARPIARIAVENPGRENATVVVFAQPAPSEINNSVLPPEERILVFDGATGVRSAEPQSLPPTSSVVKTYEVISSLHQATFGGWLVRWLYFLSGLAGTVMMVTGVVLFSVKRRRAQRNEFGNATPHIYALIEAMNVVCSAGLAIACRAYLLANRLLPAEMADRALWESRIFFAAWAATVPHALLKPSASAWREQYWRPA